MGKGTILRIHQDCELSPTFLKNIKATLGDFTTEWYSDQRNLSKSYNKRADSLHEAFNFILDAFPPDKRHKAINISHLKAYIDSCRQSCHFASESIDFLQESLTLFTAQLVKLLADNWIWTKDVEAQEAIACLNEAEQYMLMRNGAEDIATVFPTKTGIEQRYILQWDKRLSPHSKLSIAELTQIKAKQAPRTPEWFLKLEDVQQDYFCSIDKNVDNFEKLKQEVSSLHLTWLSLKEKPRLLSEHLYLIAHGCANLPQWFQRLPKNQQDMLKLLAHQSIENIQTAIENLGNIINKLHENKANDESIQLIASIPQWYWLLPEIQQRFLGFVLATSTSIEQATWFIPSRLRSIPLLANGRKHELSIADESGNIVTTFKPRYASSHIASRDVLSLPKAVQQRHVSSNLERILQLENNKTVLIQTLISPVSFYWVDNVARFFNTRLPPDYDLHRQLEQANARHSSQHIIHINHPMNIARHLQYTASNDATCLALLKLAKERLEKSSPGWSLAENYENLLNSGYGTATVFDWHGRELFLASYEQLLTMELDGLSYGSCVSGKDRKSIESMHTDAMLLYRECYHCWPKFDDTHESRQKFVNIVVDLYASSHGHCLAGQNAPGADGIKTPANYWPGDIANAICERLGMDVLKVDDTRATNNEVRCIVSTLNEQTLKNLWRYTVFFMGEEKCQQLIDALWLLVSEKKLFLNDRSKYLNLFSSTPLESKGIYDIRKLIKKHKSIENNHQKFSSMDIAGNIFVIVQQRPSGDGNRARATLSVYNLLRSLLINPEESSIQVDSVIKELDMIRENSYQFNRSASDSDLLSCRS